MALETSTRDRAHLATHLLRSFLLLAGTVSSLVVVLDQFLVGGNDFGQLVFDFVAALGVGGAIFFEVRAEVDKRV